MQQQQQQSFQVSALISDDVTRLAHEQHLGTPQAGYMVSIPRYSWRWLRAISPSFIPILLLLFMVALILFLSLLSPLFFVNTFFTVVLLIFYVLFMATLIFVNSTYKMCPLYTCEGGLVLKQSATRFKVMRWEEIGTIWHTIRRSPASLFFHSHLYTIRCHDGYTLTFSGARRSLAGLSKTLEDQFTRLHLPFQLADYRAGHTLHFGPLSLNREGIIAGDKMLSWEQVADIALEKDRQVVIYTAGLQQESWVSLPAIKVPNLCLLLALYRRMRSGQTEQEVSAEALAGYGRIPTLVQPGRRVDPLPERLAALAEEQGLGERRLDQQLGRSLFTSPAGISALTITSSILLFVGVACGIRSLAMPDNGLSSFLGEIAFFCLVFTIGGIVGIVHRLQQIHNHTYTFERGMLLKRGEQAPVVYHWEEIEAIWRVPPLFNSQSKQAMSSRRLYAHRLQLRNGASYMLTRFNIKQDALGKIVEEQIVPAQLPAVVEAYQAGQTITFGQVRVSRQGISVGAQLLPWDQVKSVSLLGSRLVIYDITRRKPWCSLPEKKIPNLFLLFALADYARNLSAQP